MAASSSVSTAPMPTSATMAHASSDSASSTASSASSSHTYSYSSSGQDARATAFRGLGVTRYLVKTSDVLEDFRITIALESSPSTVIWHTERYLTPDQIILHLIHTPTREVLWTVLRPISTRRQGWYIRLRSPQFPEGMHIPLKPIPRTSPYYVEEGCLSFRCRTNAIPLTPAPNLVAPALGHGYSDSASSTGSSVHSYPPTPPPMSPIATPNSLRSASIDLLANSHSTVATTPKIGVPKSRDIVPPSLLISEATEGPAIPPESSSAQLISPLESTTDLLSSVSLTALPGAKPSLCRLQTPSSVAGGKRRAVAPPPPLQLPSEITEFILAPMEASAALYPAQQLPGANPLHPITHTEPSTTGNNGAVSALSSIFNKALSLLKSQTSSATTGTSFTLTRIPPAPKFSHDSYGSAPSLQRFNADPLLYLIPNINFEEA
ncbi:hypothetical protein DFP72DRAFT_1173412 [Ephemerocybe angulata]|uniref:Uncharacterized protein n=1 Tax=Ephemerocybe angulata TaxID=980116 RepID=A0A8H6M2T7_9AGAR|nr:hypothetical protein DFP72DRAFT_1173412 [Tulosesus angulatus]